MTSKTSDTSVSLSEKLLRLALPLLVLTLESAAHRLDLLREIRTTAYLSMAPWWVDS